MPLSPTGIYTLPNGYLAVTGQTIEASQHNPPLEDIQAVLSEAFYRTGVAPMVANLNMNTFRLINVGNGINPNDAVNFSQLQALDPIGVPKPYLGSTAPVSHIFCFGQAISRTTFADVFAVLGTTYGAGDGSTTFNVPDLRGRVFAGRDNMGGAAAGRLTTGGSGINGSVLGAVGGAENIVLTVGQIPSHAHGVFDLGHQHTNNAFIGPTNNAGSGLATANPTVAEAPTARITTNVSATGISILPEGGGAGHVNAQPTIIVNYILRTGV